MSSGLNTQLCVYVFLFSEIRELCNGPCEDIVRCSVISFSIFIFLSVLWMQIVFSCIIPQVLFLCDPTAP